MKPSSLITMVCATLVAIGTTCWLSASEPPRKKPYPKATPPPPPSPMSTRHRRNARPTAKEIERAAREHNAMLGTGDRARAGVERIRSSARPPLRSCCPSCCRSSRNVSVAMLAQQEPGEARDLLRDEMARQWIARDRDAAIGWIKSLENVTSGRMPREIAVSALAASDPAQAIHVADQFGIGRDDGYARAPGADVGRRKSRSGWPLARRATRWCAHRAAARTHPAGASHRQRRARQ